MDPDDLLPRRKPDDTLAALARQDLDPLSVDELHARIAVLEEEIARVRARIAAAIDHRENAESLFKK